MEILVEVKTVYGNQVIYPACDKSRIFAEMLNQKTLTHRDLCKIESLGFTIKQKIAAIFPLEKV